MSMMNGAAGSSAPAPEPARARERLGLLLGLVGVLAFSLTLPMTRAAVAQLDPWFVAFGRMSIAGLIALAWLAATRAPRPTRVDAPLLAWSAAGIVVGFPLLTSLAMQTVPANHGAIINGALPFVTALMAALAYGERQRRRFWVCAALGSLLVIGFALRDGAGGGGAGGDGAAGGGALLSRGDALMFGAVLAGAVGYVAGGRFAARVGGVRAILWALAVSLPLTVPVTLWLAWRDPQSLAGAGAIAWGAFAYVTLISQIAGFFAWYNGLVLGGIARVGQVQLLQVFFTIGFAWLLFGEQVHPATWLFAAGVVVAIVVGRSGKPLNRGSR
jgi:drug/metabolite transporter (DMT)-like permease